MGRTTLGVKVDDETRARLRALAEAKDRTPHWVLKTALAEYLDREERREAERVEDDARWQRYVVTGESVPHEDVSAWLGALADGRDEPCPS